MKYEVVIIIPARFQSSRFPGKPLVQIKGKSLIQRVWEKCTLALSPELIFVATDDMRILQHCRDHRMQCLLTSSNCLTGTDRVYEASLQIESDLYLNVQGDEPLINPEDILSVLKSSQSSSYPVVNAMCSIDNEEDFRSKTVPKVVTRPDGELLYMSRAPIPTDKQHRFLEAKKQVCIYAFRKDALTLFSQFSKKTPLEEIEDIEILRFLELGIPVKMVNVSNSSIAVDIPSDVQRIEQSLHE